MTFDNELMEGVVKLAESKDLHLDSLHVGVIIGTILGLSLIPTPIITKISVVRDAMDFIHLIVMSGRIEIISTEDDPDDDRFVVVQIRTL